MTFWPDPRPWRHLGGWATVPPPWPPWKVYRPETVEDVTRVVPGEEAARAVRIGHPA